ncbi:MAG: mechanosensitive ion channel [Candidatus Palauibacterales bacterium]|nr:mechanosensitive ion channel [Candidatus Palauibacterales bacterium]
MLIVFIASQSAPVLELPSFVDMVNGLLSLVPSAFTLFLVITLAVVLRRWLERTSDPSSRHKTRNQLILLGVTAFGLLLVVLVLPIGDALRAQILSLIGIVLSAGIALSSTTFLGNMMAGIMLRAVRNFRMGDFIAVGEHFGRVSDRGLFHTEIQTEERNLTTLPNLFLVTNPVTTMRASGTIVAATVSLGYDIPRARIEKLLLQAAMKAELEDAFVTTVDLGDFSVTYRIAGLLTEVKSLITARSRLRGEMLDALHGGGVEIVSPTFMNTRPQEPDRKFVPDPAPKQRKRPVGEAPAPEDILFDKAEEAEEAEGLREKMNRVSEEMETLKAELKEAPEDIQHELEARLLRLEKERDRLAAKVEEIKNGEKGER